MAARMFQVRLLMGLLPFLGFALWQGLQSDSQYYEKSPTEIRAALKSAHLPTHILGQNIRGSSVRTPDDKTVVTALLGPEGRDAMYFVTTIEADGSGSEVTTVVKPPEGELASRASEALEKNALAAGMLDQLAQEHVAAAIEGRPFDMMFATAPAAKGMLAAMPGMSEHINRANATASEFAKAEQDWAERREEEEFREEYGDDWGASGTDHSDGWGDE